MNLISLRLQLFSLSFSRWGLSLYLLKKCWFVLSQEYLFWCCVYFSGPGQESQISHCHKRNYNTYLSLYKQTSKTDFFPPFLHLLWIIVHCQQNNAKGLHIIWRNISILGNLLCQKCVSLYVGTSVMWRRTGEEKKNIMHAEPSVNFRWFWWVLDLCCQDCRLTVCFAKWPPIYNDTEWKRHRRGRRGE